MAHPDVPKQYRYASYKEDISKTDHFTDKWHWMSITGYSQFLDSMCLYARLRKVSGREVSYKLDDIANKELGQGKLHFGEMISKIGVSIIVMTFNFVTRKKFLE